MQTQIKELLSNVNRKLDICPVSSNAILSRFKFIDDVARRSLEYSDPTYMPFYYYIGCIVKPENFLEIGFQLGLRSACFLLGCRSVFYFLAMQEKNGFYSPRIGISNIKTSYKGEMNIHVGSIMDNNFIDLLSGRGWDFVIFNEIKPYDELMSTFEIIWKHMNADGLLLVDHVSPNRSNRQAYSDFCKVKNRETNLFNTRYGTGLVQK